MKSERTSRRAAAIGLTAGLVGGGAAGLVFGVPALTSASPPSVLQQTDEPSDTQSDTDTDTKTDATEAERAAERTERVRELLQDLIDDGTIDASQADAVAEHLAEQAPEGGHHGGFGRMGRGGGHLGPGASLEVLTDVLGLDADELRDQLEGGATLAEIAEANDVDVDSLVDALVAEQTERLDQAVEDGRLEADRADELEAELEERITDAINRSGPMGGGPFHRGGDADDDAEADSGGDAEGTSLTTAPGSLDA